MYWEDNFAPAEYMPEHNKQNLRGAKFKIGEQIILNREQGFMRYNGRLYTVVAMGKVEPRVYEYWLKGFPFLCWECELEKL